MTKGTNQITIVMTNVLVKKILLLAFLLAMMGMANGQDLQWINGYTSGLGAASATKTDASGNVYFAGGFAGTVDFDPGPGTTNLTSAGSFDIYISKLDASGNLLWAHRIGGSSNDGVGTLELDASGNVYVTGWFQESNIDFNPGAGTNNLTSAGGTDVYVLKLNSSGTFQWVYQGGGSSQDEGHGLAIDGSGNVYVAGDTNGGDFDNTAGTTTLGENGLADVFVVQLNASGTFQWGVDVGGTGRDEVNDLELESSGDLFVGGIFSNTVDFDPSGSVANKTSNGLLDAFLLQLSNNGTFQEVITWGGTSNDGLNDLTFTSTGSVVATSYFDGTIDVDPYAGTKSIIAGSSDTDQLVHHFDIENDELLWYKQIDITSAGLFGIDIDANDRIYHAGFYSLFGIVEIYDVDGNDEFSIAPIFGIKAYGAEVEGTNFYIYGSFTGNRNFDFCGGTNNVNGLSGDKAFVAKYAIESLADQPTLTATATSIFPTESTTISIQSGNLNGATDWEWYTGSCGGTPVGSGTSINVSPTTSTTYFVRGEGYSCITEGNCASITITVEDPFLIYGSSFNLTDGGTYSGNSFDFSNESTSTRSITFSNDGLKMFLMAGNRNVYQYSLSTAFDLGSTITHDGSPYATGMNEPRGIKFSPDGTKMHIVDNKLNQITQFSLTTPFDITSGVTSDGSRSVQAQTGSNSAWGIAFNANGTRMFISGILDDLLHQYTLESAYDVTSSVTYDNVTFDPTNELLNPTYLTFNPEGTILYISNYQYSLATPFDISLGVTPIGPIVLTNNQNINIHGVHFSDDGTKLYLGSDFDDSVHEYLVNTGGFVETEENDGSLDGSLLVSITGDTFTSAGSTLAPTIDYAITNLPTGLSPTLTVDANGLTATLTLTGKAAPHQDVDDLSGLDFTFENSAFTNSDASVVIDAIGFTTSEGIDYNDNKPVLVYDYVYNPANFSFGGTFGVLAQEGGAHGLTFNDDGTKVYIVGTINDQVFQYSLSTAFDITTASLEGNSVSLNAQDDSPLGLTFNNDGSRLFVAGASSETVLEYALTTPYDVTTGFSFNSNSLDVSGGGSPSGLTFSEDGMKLFTVSTSTDQVNQYSLTTAYDISSGVTVDGSFSVLDQENTPTGIAFSESGTTMIIMGGSTQASQKYVHNYHLSNPFDVTSGVTPYENPVNVNGFEFSPTDIAFSKNGNRMFILGVNGDEINQFNMQLGSLTESTSNDGSITGSYTLQVYDEWFTNVGGTLTQGADYSISNLPAGLSSSLAVAADGKTAVLTISGTASSHDNIQNVESLNFTFENSAFSIGNASLVANATSASSELSIYFIEAPVIANQTFSIAENSVSTTSVGTVVATDGDGESLTFSITAGNDLGGFSIDTNSGEITVADQTDMDFETNPTFDLTVEVSDGSLSNSATITIDLTNVDEAPTDIALDQNAIDENNAVDDIIGQLSTTDEDAGETYTYTFVSGTGDADNASFNINGDELRASSSFDFETKNSYTVRIQTDDQNGGTFSKAFAVNINDIFETPTDINLFGTSINENNAVDAEIGTLFTTDDDGGETHTYTLVSGTGDTDNVSFTILDDKLRASESFDFENKNSYDIRIQTNDGNGGTYEEQFTITISDVSEAPTDITLGASEITENNGINDVIGSLSSTDQDAGETFSYSLVSGTGDTDNTSFNIDGDQLRASEIFDFEANSSYSIRIQTNDGNFGTFEKVFTITINNQQEVPTDILLSSSDINESSPVGTTVGNLSTEDEDNGETYTYSFVSGTGDTDNASFNLSGSELRSAEVFNFETKTSYTVRIQTNDGNGGLLEKAFTISINDQPPGLTGIGITSNTIDENEGVGSGIGNLFALGDEIEGVAFTFTLVSGTGDTGNGSFTIVGVQLRSTISFDHDSQDQYSIRVMADDGAGSTIEQILLIDINDVNEAPLLVDVNENEYDEGLASGTVLTGFFVSDEDDSDSHSFSLVSGAGSTDNNKFEIQGQNLANLEAFDFESQSEYSIRVRATDAGGLSVESIIAIFVNDLNDNPSDIIFSSTQIDENSSIGSVVSTMSSTDEDIGDSHIYSLVSGSGDTDNALFTVSGNSLELGFVPDYETKSSYAVRIQADDSNGGTFQKAVVITINDLNEHPTDISLSNSAIEESNPISSYVGSLTSVDEDASQTHSYSFVSGAGDTDNSSFTISGSDILSGEVFDFETKNVYYIRILSEDGNGGSFEKSFTISIDDLPASITSFVLSNGSINENESAGSTVGSFTTSGEDLSGSFTYSLVSGVGDDDNIAFSISGNQLSTGTSFDFESQNTYSVRVMVDDGTGNTDEKAFAISVVDVSESPTDLTLNANSITENNSIGDVIGTLSTTDEDAGESFTYIFASGTGDTDNASFDIVGNELQAAEAFDFETQNSYSVRIETNDGNSGTFSKSFSISITDENESILVSNPIADQNLDEGFTSLEIDLSTVFTDQDADDLIYEVSSSNETVVTVGNSGTTLTISEVGDLGSSTVTVTADDGSGITTSDEFIVTVSNVNDAPVVVNTIADQNLNEGFGSLEVDLSSTFSDEDGDALTLEANSDDENVVIASIIGTILSINEVGNGSTTITVTANDGNGGTVSDKFVVTVNNVNDAPVVANAISDQNVNEGFGSLELDLSNTFTDEDGGALSLEASSADENVVNVSITGTTLSIAEVGNGTTTVTITANDGNGGSVSDEFIVTVSEAPNNAPIVVNPLGDQTSLVEGFDSAQINYADVFEDPDGDALTIAVSSGDESVVTVVVVANDQIQINEIGVGTTTITLTANDGNGGSVSDEFIVTVSEAPNNAPIVVNPLGDQTSLVEGFDSAQINYADVFEDPDGDALTISVSSSDKAVVTVEVIANDQIQLNEIGVGTATITLTANDGNGGSVSDEFIVTVSEAPNNAPVVINPLDDQTSLVEGFDSAQINYADVFEDPDGDALTISISSSDEAVVTVEVIANDQIQLNEIGVGTATITLTADDGNGGSVSDEFIVTVSEAPNNAPVVINPLDDQTSLVEGFDSAQINYADVFEDPDGDALTISVSSSNEAVVTVEVIANDQIQISEVGIGTATITLTANDGNGGSVSDEFIVTVNEGALGIEDEIAVKVYPNPASDFIQIDASREVEVNLFDLNGRSLKSGKGLSIKLDLRSMGSGAYILKVINEKGSKTQRIIKTN